jgi:NADPH-dependent 7-cyano-7-deazaguanine reductase QueF
MLSLQMYIKYMGIYILREKYMSDIYNILKKEDFSKVVIVYFSETVCNAILQIANYVFSG